MMTVAAYHGTGPSVPGLCTSLGVAPATYYRASRRAQTPTCRPARGASARALAPDEQQRVLAVLHEERFRDLAPAQVYAMRLDEGTYLCAERTMYRVLAAHAALRKRRAPRRHPVYAAPERLATAPKGALPSPEGRCETEAYLKSQGRQILADDMGYAVGQQTLCCGRTAVGGSSCVGAAEQHVAVDKRFTECSRRSLLFSSLATGRWAFGGLARDVGLAVRWLTVILLV